MFNSYFNGRGSLYVFSIFLLYIVPVLTSQAINFDIGGAGSIGLEGAGAVAEYLVLWTVAVVSFMLGMGSIRGSVALALPRHAVKSIAGLLMVVGPATIATKVLLQRQGVYESYAFDSGQMSGGVWTFSMALAEIDLYLFAASLLLKNAKLTAACLFLVALNLIHGTRIFAAGAISISYFFWISTHQISLKKFMAMVVSVFLVVGLGMVIFIFRSHVEIDYSQYDQLFKYFISPIVYESLFSQLALIDFANGLKINFVCSPIDYYFDVLGFIVPRILNPDKDALCISYLDDLQPLGALNGVFAVYAYFGTFSFVLFGLFGFIGRAFFRFGRRNYYAMTLSLYFSGSIVLRLVRDGPVYAMKFLSMAVFGCLSLFVIELMLEKLSLRKQGDRLYAGL